MPPLSSLSLYPAATDQGSPAGITTSLPFLVSSSTLITNDAQEPQPLSSPPSPPAKVHPRQPSLPITPPSFPPPLTSPSVSIRIMVSTHREKQARMKNPLFPPPLLDHARRGRSDIMEAPVIVGEGKV